MSDDEIVNTAIKLADIDCDFWPGVTAQEMFDVCKTVILENPAASFPTWGEDEIIEAWVFERDYRLSNMGFQVRAVAVHFVPMRLYYER